MNQEKRTQCRAIFGFSGCACHDVKPKDPESRAIPKMSHKKKEKRNVTEKDTKVGSSDIGQDCGRFPL
jgi:hypothetical protein